MNMSLSISALISAAMQQIKFTLQNKIFVFLLIFLGMFTSLGAWYWYSTTDDRLAQKYIDEFIHLGIDLNEPLESKDKQDMEKYNEAFNLWEKVDLLAKHTKNASKYTDFVNRFAPTQLNEEAAMLNSIHGKD